MKLKQTFIREGRFWRFPSAPQPRIATVGSVRRDLPLYVTYPEFVEAAGKFLNWERKVPSKDEVLRICRQIKVDQTDFLASVWMKDVKKAWAETLTPCFLFCSADADEQYIWCEVRSAKGWDVWTFLLLAVDGCGSLLRYTFYSPRNASGRYMEFTVRTHETRFEKEVCPQNVRSFFAHIRRMHNNEDHMICGDSDSDEYVQAQRNRDGTFYMEYQLYHMPWQMKLDNIALEELIRITKQYLKGGIPAIANEAKWALCEHNIRKPVDLGLVLKVQLEKAEKARRELIVETLHAVGITGMTKAGDFVVPLFVSKRGRLVHWTTSQYYLPKNTSKHIQAMVKVAAALLDPSQPQFLHETGEAFANGDGIPRDLRLALYWERRAYRNGSWRAQNEIRRLEALLNPRREQKSAACRNKLELRLQSVIDEYKAGKLDKAGAYDEMYDVEVDGEMQLHDCSLKQQDYRLLEKSLKSAWESLEGDD